MLFMHHETSTSITTYTTILYTSQFMKDSPSQTKQKRSQTMHDVKENRKARVTQRYLRKAFIKVAFTKLINIDTQHKH